MLIMHFCENIGNCYSNCATVLWCAVVFCGLLFCGVLFCGVAARHDHHKLSIINLQLGEANCTLSIVHCHCPLYIIHCSLSIVHCPLSIVHYPLSIIHCPLSIVHYPLSIINFKYHEKNLLSYLSDFPLLGSIFAGYYSPLYGAAKRNKLLPVGQG